MTTSTTTCHNHPNRETGLRCNRCDEYICAACAVRTPAGYRCKACVRQQKKVFDTAKAQDFVVAFVIAGALSFIGGIVLEQFGFFVFYLAFIAGPGVGSAIAEAVRRAVGKRRSKALFLTAVAGVVLGGMFLAADEMYYLVIYRQPYFFSQLLWPAIYVFLAATTTYTRLSGFQFRQ